MGNFTLSAQEAAEVNIVPFQLSFITPLGTNGIQYYTTNRLSINILAGYAQGLQGLEVGGFANILGEDMSGLQAAGFVNAVFGQAKGVQLAGFTNVCGNGFTNGVQASGFVNIVNGDAQILQATGFANAVTGKNTGLQAAGFVNYARGVSGAQFSGFVNISMDKLNGMQATGFVNAIRNDAVGAQLSGFANLVSGEITGTQLAGFFNYANKITGTQIGFLNYANEMNGVPIGFLSYVKNGYRTFEISGNESFFGNFSFKTGHHKFYNILSLGASIKDNQILWGYGYGVGSSFILSNTWGMQLEAISYHVNEDEWFTDKLNLLNRLNVVFSYQLSPHVTVFAGPSLNVFVTSDPPIEPQGNDLPPIVPGGFFDKNYGNERVIIYPGINLGIRL